jgi:probable HAF family extracellular repeat protein
MARKIGVLCCSLVFLVTLTVARAHAQRAPIFTTVDFAGAVETDVNDINRNGVMVGHQCSDNLCDDPNTPGTAHAWVNVNGTFRNVRIPGSSQSRAYGINDKNQIVGWAILSDGLTHGFMFDKGNVTTLDPPGSTLTNAWSINNAGIIVGTFVDVSGVFRGFILRNGQYKVFDAPNGALLTEITAINNHNQMGGIYFDSAGLQHGFTLVGQTFTDVSFPRQGVIVTAVDRINDSGDLVGLWGTDTAGPFQGYLRVGTQYTPVNFPGSSETRCRGINNAGVITGRYTGSDGNIHGMTVTP